MTNEFDKETQKTIDNIYEQIEVLKGKVDELKSGPKNKNVRWRAEKGEFYYSFNGFLDTSLKTESLDEFDNCRYNAGFYFKTKEEAEKYKNNLIITQKLKDIALRLNRTSAYFHFIYLDLDGELATSYQSIKVMGGIYCANPDFLETAIKEIGEKELIEYIKER